MDETTDGPTDARNKARKADYGRLLAIKFKFKYTNGIDSFEHRGKQLQ